jgi:hypothetical protein
MLRDPLPAGESWTGADRDRRYRRTTARTAGGLAGVRGVLSPTVRAVAKTRRRTGFAGRQSPGHVQRSVCRLLEFTLLAGIFFCAVSIFKLDRDPANDNLGKCVVVVSAGAVTAVVLHRLYHDRARSLVCLASAPRVSGFVPELLSFAALRPLTRSRCPAFQRTVCSGL